MQVRRGGDGGGRCGFMGGGGGRSGCLVKQALQLVGLKTCAGCCRGGGPRGGGGGLVRRLEHQRNAVGAVARHGAAALAAEKGDVTGRRGFEHHRHVVQRSRPGAAHAAVKAPFLLAHAAERAVNDPLVAVEAHALRHTGRGQRWGRGLGVEAKSRATHAAAGAAGTDSGPVGRSDTPAACACWSAW